VHQDYAEAIRWFQKAAEQGNADAQYYLGSLNVEGKGVAQNYAEALKWYRKAADQGNASAQYELGVIYQSGLGGQTNYPEALKWYRKAADQGNSDAQHNLGTMYSSGRGVPQNSATAAGWFRKAADQGVADSQNNLGLMYENGQGVQKNYAEALKWYQRAADQGNEVAKNNFSALNSRFPNLRTQLSTPAAPAISQSGAGQTKTSTAQPSASSAAPIPMHSGWVTIKDHEIDGGFKIFRRYAYSENDQKVPFANLIMFLCSINSASAASHLTFVLPKGLQPNSFPRDKWLPKTSVRFLIDDHQSVSVPGEYRNGEFYFDWNSETNDDLSKIMLSNKLAMGFGDKNDIIEFRFIDGMDKLYSKFARKFMPELQISHYEKSGVGGVLDACRAYQQGTLAGLPAAQARVSEPKTSEVKEQNPANTSKGSKGASPSLTAQSTSTMLLTGGDLKTVVGTYQENEMRFKRDFLGRQFSDVLPFRSTTESMFSKGSYRVGFGTGNFSSDVDCTANSPAEIAEIANWNKGDKIRIVGVVKDVTMGSVILDPCKLSK